MINQGDIDNETESTTILLDKILTAIHLIFWVCLRKHIKHQYKLTKLLILIQVDLNLYKLDIFSRLNQQIETNISKDCLVSLVSEENNCFVTIDDDIELLLKLTTKIHNEIAENAAMEMIKIYDIQHCCIAWSIINCLRGFDIVIKKFKNKLS